MSSGHLSEEARSGGWAKSECLVVMTGIEVEFFFGVRQKNQHYSTRKRADFRRVLYYEKAEVNTKWGKQKV